MVPSSWSENVDRILRQAEPDEGRVEVVARACVEVGRPIVFAIVIIILVFLPLFTLQGVEGKTFRPLAYTVAMAMLGSLIFALFLAPVLSNLLLRAPKSTDAGTQASEGWMMRRLVARVSTPSSLASLPHRFWALASGGASSC